MLPQAIARLYVMQARTCDTQALNAVCDCGGIIHGSCHW